MKKGNDNMYFIRAGLYDWIKDFEEGIDIDIFRFSYIVRGGYIDVVGDSGDNNKYDGKMFWCVELKEDNKIHLADLEVVYRGDIEVISTYPEYTVDTNNCIVVDKENFTEESYINALKMMTEKAKELRVKEHSAYGVRIIAELINEEMIVFKLIYVRDFFRCYDFEYYGTYEKISDVAKYINGKEMASYGGMDFYLIESHDVGIDAKCKITYKKYGQPEEVVEIDDTFERAEYFWDIIHGIRREVRKYNLEMTSLDKFGMDIYKMDELAGYFAMEYMLQYDLERVKYYKKSEERISCKDDSFYDTLHCQNTTMEYCKTLQSFLENMPLDKIVQGYEELKNNPDKDVLDIFHTVYDGRYKLNYAEEEAYNTHLYEEGQVYLAVVYEERVDKNEHINDAYIVLMSEKEQYEKGKEILAHRYMPRFRFDEDYAIPYSAYEHVRNGEQKRAAIAIMKNNTFEQDGKKYMHTWSNEVVMVKVVGKHKNGMLLTELYQYC